MNALPAGATASNVRFVSRCDQGGRPDGVQVIVHKGHAYIGHMFSDGFSVVDVRDAKNPKTVAFVAAPKNTRSHHLQVTATSCWSSTAPNIWAMAQYQSQADYYSKSLADAVQDRAALRRRHARVRHFEAGAAARNRLPGHPGPRRAPHLVGRRQYAYASVHFEGFIDHALAILDVSDPAKPQLAGSGGCRA